MTIFRARTVAVTHFLMWLTVGLPAIRKSGHLLNTIPFNRKAPFSKGLASDFLDSIS